MKRIPTYLLYCLLALACAFSIFPLAWGFVTSLKGEAEVVAFPPTWLPGSPTLENYAHVLSSSLPHYLMNSILVAALTIVLSLAIAAHAGYAVSRFDFRGRTTLLYVILASMMVARVSNVVPLYLLSSRFGLLDTKLVLILVYSGWQMPIAVWLLKDFFSNVPQSLDRAAQVDGYGSMAIFYRIALPLVRPGLAAAAILIFMFVWNDFILAVTLTTSESNRMVTVGLYNYVGQFGIQWGQLTAAVMVALLPVVILFAIVQKTLTHGLTAGAVKG
ncbi:MAG: carbohydrate ABC transporter permease [Pseudomonadota bacterium]